MKLSPIKRGHLSAKLSISKRGLISAKLSSIKRGLLSVKMRSIEGGVSLKFFFFKCNSIGEDGSVKTQIIWVFRVSNSFIQPCLKFINVFFQVRIVEYTKSLCVLHCIFVALPIIGNGRADIGTSIAHTKGSYQRW